MIIFPEGRVVKNKAELGKVYKKGAAFIAAHLDKPIIPVFITTRPKPFSKVKLIYGEPYFINKEDKKHSRNLDEISKELVEKIYTLNEKKEDEKKGKE